MLTRAEVIAYYAEKTGFSVETFDFYEVFGLFRLAVIIQQIYRRYAPQADDQPALRRLRRDGQHAGPALPGADRPIGALGMADLVLVRHGQASFGAAHYDKLSALGRAAIRAARAFG